MSALPIDPQLSLLNHWAQQRPDALALTLSDRALTWQQLRGAVTAVSQAMAEQGLVRDDVVVAVAKNCDELLLLYLACLESGVVCALVAPQTTLQLAQKLAILGCNKAWLGRGASEITLPESCQQIRLSIVPEWDGAADLSRTLYSNAESTGSIKPTFVKGSPELASIVFTSGSTGESKAVAHHASQHIASASGLLERLPFSAQDSWLLSLPMYHVSGLAIVWRWLWVGARIKIGGGDLLLDLSDISHASLVATQLQQLLSQSRPLSLRVVLLGGSHIPTQLAQQARANGIETWLGYGMTEAASTVTARRMTGEECAEVGVGEILPKRQLKLQGNRILISGETLASGYYKRGKLLPLASKHGAALDTPQCIDWFDSGDLGFWKGDELVILGRADNQFISGGENIYCEEIEQLLYLHPQVDKVVVIPVSCTTYGARPVAVVSSRAGLQVSGYEEILRQRLERYKWPIDYFLLPDLEQLTRGMKISRPAVKAWLQASQDCYQPI